MTKPINVGVIHKGEYVIPAPYDYPKWWTKVSKFVWPWGLKMFIQSKVRVYNAERDVLGPWREN